MKNIYILLLLFSPLTVIGQWSISGSYLMDPFFSLTSDQESEDFEQDKSLLKEINLALSYSLPKAITFRAGISRLDKKNASSYRFIQDNVIDGFPAQFENLTLRHRAGIRTYSIFTGVQIDLYRFHLVNQLHLSHGVFKDAAIVGREFTSFTGQTTETFYGINYNSLNFFKADLSIVYDLYKAEKGVISFVLKYMRDFSETHTFNVKEYDPEVRAMVENFPGSTFYDLDTFLEGGPLYYDREFWGLGLRMSYYLHSSPK